VVTVAIALAIAGGLWVRARRSQDEADREARIAQVKQLVDTGRFVDVWRVARAGLQRWPGDPELEQMLHSTSQTVTLTTEPSGADLAFRAYDDLGGEWLPIGKSPLNGVSVPLGMLRWRITMSGFDQLEARLEVGTPAAAALRPDIEAKPIRLRPVGSAAARMVFVPGGQFEGVLLTDYWLDQYEVTNREFKAFVDRGGYDGRFRDGTGRPGPATWQLGTYPAGQDGYPVSGVSWFEADAYCRSVGKSLPTLYHWHRAFGAAFFAEVVTAGNFGGRGAQSTERLNDVGPFGTYGQAGNVKEWLWNETDGQRYILGGSWNEPVYMAVEDDRRPPLDRAETNGFRCMKESAPSPAAAYAAQAKTDPRDFTKEKPVDDATFEIFRRFYSYDRTPLDARIESVQESEYWRRERASFAAAYGDERVPVNILIPRNASPPYQAVVWFPGSYALELKHSDGDLPFSYYFDYLPRSGRALVYPVYKGTYERARRSQSMSQRRDTVRQWSQDLSRTVDYLNSRSDFDREKIGYYGFSMGADPAIPAVALEPRFKAVVLLAGGLSDFPVPPESQSLNFLPRLKTPVLLLGGRHDFYYSVEGSQKPLFNLLGTPAEHKRHVIFEHAGHVPPRIDVIREVLGWFDRYMGPVDARR
jgi:dienelactone hydrolase